MAYFPMFVDMTGKRVSDRRRWKCGIPQGDRNAGFWREGHGCGRGYM